MFSLLVNLFVILFSEKMSKPPGLKHKVNKLVKKIKLSDEGFSYIGDDCDFECLGRKGLWSTYKKLGFGISFEKDFQSQLFKLVMNIPIIERNSKEK